MKSPAPAFLIQSRGAPFWSVSIRRVLVLRIDTSAQTAVVEMGTQASRIRGLEVTVPFSRLAREQSRALTLAAAELAKLSTEAAGKSAAIETAGAGHAAPAASAQLPGMGSQVPQRAANSESKRGGGCPRRDNGGVRVSPPDQIMAAHLAEGGTPA